MRAMDVMTSKVITVDENASVQTAAKLLVEYGISAVPVVGKDDRVIGMVSEGDLANLNDWQRGATLARAGHSRAAARRRPIWWVSRQGEVAMKVTNAATAVAPGNGTSDIARPGHRQ